MSGCALGVDLGLSGARAVVMQRDGSVVGSGRKELPAWDGDPPRMNPEHLLAAVESAARCAISAAGERQIDVFAVAAFGPCPILLRDDMSAAAPMLLFGSSPGVQNNRGRETAVREEELDDVEPRIAFLNATCPEQAGEARWVVDVTGFVVASATGIPTIDRATAYYHGRKECAHLQSPAPQEAGDVAGPMRAAFARRLGLPAGIPVLVGSCDSYVDLAAMDVAKPGDVGLLVGTTLVAGSVCTGRIVGEGLRSTPHLGVGWLLGGWTSACGSLVDWSVSTFGRDAAEEAAALPPGAGGLLMLPYLAGERAPVWDGAARGAVVGMTLRTSVAEMHRATIDSVALSAADIVSRIGRLSPVASTARVTGGAAANASLLAAISNATGLTLELDRHYAEATGPARLGLNALGSKPPFDIVSRLAPEPVARSRYEGLLALYRDLYPALASTMHAVSAFEDRPWYQAR